MIEAPPQRFQREDLVMNRWISLLIIGLFVQAAIGTADSKAL